MTDLQRVAALRSAAGWLLCGTIVIVVDLRIGGSSGPGLDRVGTSAGIDVINDVIGAGLVVVGVHRLRAAVGGVFRTDPWVTLAWVAAMVNVPLILLEEVTGLAFGPAEHAAAELLSLLVTFGGTSAAAWSFHRAVTELSTDTDLADRWRRNVWWVGLVGGIPALITTLAPLVGLVEPDDRGAIVAMAAGGAVLGTAALAFGLIALVMLLTALSRTRQLPDPSPGPSAGAPPPNASDVTTS